MGVTFGAVHVNGANRDRVIAYLEKHLASEGFTRLESSAEPWDLERRIVLLEEGGWVTVADEDLVTRDEAADVLGRALASAFGDAIAITVFHSDTAILARYRKGDLVGRFQVPESGTPDEESGHRHVVARFLADLAVSPEANKELQTGLLADHTFPEETTSYAASLIGLPNPQASAHYLWDDPPKGAVKLRFALPKEDVPVVTAGALDGRPHASDGYTIHVVGSSPFEACEEMPLYEQLTFYVEAQGGGRVEGLAIELSGPGLALLDVPALAGWNPNIAPGETTDIVVSLLETHASSSLLARFPNAIIGPATQPVLAGTSAAALRAWQAALHAQAKNKFCFHLRGTARASGRGDLVVRLLDGEGRLLGASEARVALSITPAPRMPIVLSPREKAHRTAEADEATSRANSDRRRLTAAAQYSGAQWLSGWIAFDMSFAEAGDFVLEAASALASRVAQSTGPLAISITTAGTHPKVAKPFQAGDALGDIKPIRLHLSKEADVHLHVPYAAISSANFDHSTVRLRHQPHGPTVLDEEMRARLADGGPSPRTVPLDLSFSIRRATAGADLAATVDRIFREAAALPGCIGGFVVPTGEPLGDQAARPTPYEDLLDLHQSHEQVDAVRRRPRSPGWRVIVAHEAADALDRRPGVTITETAAGVLLAPAGDDPFAMTDDDREAIERTLLPAFARALDAPRET